MQNWLNVIAYLLLCGSALCFGLCAYNLRRNKYVPNKKTRIASGGFFLGTLLFGFLGFLALMRSQCGRLHSEPRLVSVVTVFITSQLCVMAVTDAPLRIKG